MTAISRFSVVSVSLFGPAYAHNTLIIAWFAFEGKSHPHIVKTMDIYSDYNRHIFLFQEYANRGNGMDFVKSGNHVSEEQMRVWSQHIYTAMDFLGDLGISHRSIHPKHILL